MSPGSSDAPVDPFLQRCPQNRFFFIFSVLPEICSIWLPGHIGLLWPDEIANIPECSFQKASCFE